MKCERIDCMNRNLVNIFIKEHWYTTTRLIRGKEIDMTKTEGFYFREEEDIIGLITYIIYDNILEITSLERGFDMAHLFRNALDISRKLKPEIPLIGENSIPLRHEIEFEMLI